VLSELFDDLVREKETTNEKATVLALLVTLLFSGCKSYDLQTDLSYDSQNVLSESTISIDQKARSCLVRTQEFILLS